VYTALKGCPFNSPNFNSPNSNYRVRVRDRVRRIEIRRIEKEPTESEISAFRRLLSVCMVAISAAVQSFSERTHA